MLHVSRLGKGITVSAQLNRHDFRALAEQGVTLIVNNRLDNEKPGQLSAYDAAALSRHEGMAYRHIPVKLTDITSDDVAAFGRALADAAGPVHAHCRTGIRAATLWALYEVTANRKSPHQVQAALQMAGFDPKTALAWLHAHKVLSPP